MSYKGPEGRTTGYYVPKAFHQRVRDGMAAWKGFQTLGKALAQLNRDILAAEKEEQKKARKK